MTKLPTALTMTNLVGDLIGQQVTAKATTVQRLDPTRHVAAAYRDESGELLAVAMCDVAVGASFAAALSMVPASRVDDCVRDCRLDDILRENLHEVFNVLSAAFPMSGGPRVVLHEMRCRQAPSVDVAAVLAKPGIRLDLEIAVAGYRSGKFALLAA